ncbi:MAG: nitroreductase family protein [Clostridia bacterium]|nr:nitroreductase family protein [Clostridia bacterium]
MPNTGFLALAEQRYSVRKFATKQVEQVTLERILRAGQVAPTACNKQPQMTYVLRSTQAMEKLRRCTTSHFDAPMALLVCYDMLRSWKRSYDEQDSGWVDASIVATHMMLEAYEQGVGSTWVMHFDPDAIRNEFALPESQIPVAILVMGYPADDVQASPMHSRNKAMHEIVKYL